MIHYRSVKYGRQVLLVLIGFLLILSGSPSSTSSKVFAQQQLLYYTWPPFPSGTVAYALPAIQMKVRFEGLPPSAYRMTLNGREVPVRYDAMQEKFLYQPDAPLSPGEYKVSLTLEWNGYEPKTYNWSFTIRNQAVQMLPPVTEGQNEALRAVNDIRQDLGLPLVKLNGNLTLAAEGHARYQQMNGEITHTETAGKPGFTGATLAERLQAAGYGNSSASEDISRQKGANATKAIDDLYDAPYHRVPFLSPALTEIGYANAGEYHVLMFGFEEERGNTEIVVSPSDAGSPVPVSWNGNEIPDPLRVHSGEAYPVGYPILLGVYGSGIVKVELQQADLTDELGSSVALLRSSAANDDKLDAHVILIPKHPMQAGHTYTAHVKANVQLENGGNERKELTWSFRTESRAGEGRLAVHGGEEGAGKGLPAELKRHLLTFGLDRNVYTLDGIIYPMLVHPFLLEGSSYLAARDLGQALGAQVDWDNGKRAALFRRDDREVVLYVDKPYYEVNGTAYYSAIRPQLAFRDSSEPRTVVPVRLLSDLLGCSVEYDNASRTVRIAY